MNTSRYAIEKIDTAVAAGSLEPLAGTGKPIPNLTRDPDWWVRALLNRERHAEQLGEIKAYRKNALAEAVSCADLATARSLLASLNYVLERWNENAPEPFILEPISEIRLITERAQAPGR